MVDFDAFFEDLQKILIEVNGKNMILYYKHTERTDAYAPIPVLFFVRLNLRVYQNSWH